MQTGNYTEDYSICPFDKSHIILNHKLAIHNVKCARNHPDSDVVLCPFNSSHGMPKSEKKLHMENCTDRAQFDNFITQQENARPKIVVDFSNDPVSEKEEIWETDTPAYDPEENCKNKAVILRFDVGSKTQHRQARQEQYERFNRLEMEQHGAGKSSTS